MPETKIYELSLSTNKVTVLQPNLDPFMHEAIPMNLKLKALWECPNVTLPITSFSCMPDGKSILFVWNPMWKSYFRNAQDIYVMDLNSCQVKQLTDFHSDIRSVLPAQDGTTVLFLRRSQNGAPELCTMAKDGSNFAGRAELLPDGNRGDSRLDNHPSRISLFNPGNHSW
jgi:Tol biopolymer transport system component